MRQFIGLFLTAVLVLQVQSAPQLISFKDGKIGVNFAGYHASAGLGGLLGGGGTGGGLFAEAGTPFGPAARAGLGGAVDSNSGGAAGGLYAGATAGGNVKAAAGLGGGVTGEQTAGGLYAGANAGHNVKAAAGIGGGVDANQASGNGFATSDAGGYHASSGLGGAAGGEGSAGFLFSATKSVGGNGGVVKQIVQPVQTVQTVPQYNAENTNVQLEADNEVNFVPLSQSTSAPAVIIKEVYVQPPPTKVVQKEIVRTHYKPHRHHFRKTAYVGGYIGANGYDVPPPPPAPVVYKSVQPVIEKRIDYGAESVINNAGGLESIGGGGGEIGYTKQVTFHRNPNFFADIFNIPISTLKAVGNFLGNTAGSTNISVQKSATLQAGAFFK